MLNATAQKKKIFLINPGEKVADAIPKNEIYSSPEFKAGTVYFKNGDHIAARLSYNYLFDEMQFIDVKGDTLSLANEETIRLIAVGKDTFCFDKVYLKLIADYGEMKLAVKQFFALVNRQKLGSVGETSSAAIDTYEVRSSSNHFKDMIAQEVITLAIDNRFYVGDKFNDFKIINKKNLLEAYDRKKLELQTYLKENKVDFSNEEDLRKLMAFLKE